MGSTLAEGAEVYAVDVGNVRARGITYDQETLDELLRDRVLAIAQDVQGRADVRELVADLASTEFEDARLNEIVQAPEVEEMWRLGEAIAEVFLVDCRACLFPWPAGRDQKNPASSLTGADLVGFVEHTESVRFAFGEVKTSESSEAPPSVMYGRSGLIAQLEGLRDDNSTKDALVLYLGFRAASADWCESYRAATSRYLADTTDVSLYGVLIKDVEPNPLDLQNRAVALAKDQPPQTGIELRAKYLPPGALSSSVTSTPTSEGE